MQGTGVACVGRVQVMDEVIKVMTENENNTQAQLQDGGLRTGACVIHML